MKHRHHKLEYHRHTDRASFHWKKWIGWASVALLLAAVGIIIFVELPTIRHDWFQQQCLIYQGDANVAVFDSRPSALATFHRSGTGWKNGALIVYHRGAPATSIPYLAFIPPVLVRFDPALELKQDPQAVVFMHLRMSPSGNRRLVIVVAIPADGLAATVINPKTRDVPSSVKLASNPIHVRAGMWDLDTKPVAIFAGQIDKLHPDHFTISYQIDNNSHIVNCWLLDDDSIRMVDSSVTPSSQPSPALSH